ncbi:hypothetical protein MUA90_00055 [Staphylococcus sp. IVB6181]|uniref:hypothetical protein n=1 Tax=Staphylococcus sp. IVB6181 TaxID=2929481 RepID=UPI0021CDFAEA|nr:hypothetical protein [Staphylococcus sp. IVB6181]UXV34986.1 hypothetical protein MUA90_00055 [Staphylococcus sp. IVB6181]
MSAGAIITYVIVLLLLVVSVILSVRESKKEKGYISQKMIVLSLSLNAIASLIILIFGIMQLMTGA